MIHLKFLLVASILGVVTCCDKGYVEISDGTCLPYVTEYHGECTDSAQCEWLGDNSECKYVCRCKEGFRWYLGECKKYVGLGEECSDSIDCYDGYNLQSLTCLSGTCQCSNGYYQRGNIDCRKIAQVNETCALDIDCQDPDKKTVCHLGTCVLRPTSKKIAEEEEIEIQKFLSSTDQLSCTSNTDCTGPNSECFEKTGTCICKKSYFLDNDNKCTAELGVNTGCKDDTDCPLRPGKCEDGVCYCRDYYFAEDGNRKCVKTMSQNNRNCLSKEWCYAFGKYVYCNSNETCACSSIAEFDGENLTCGKIKDNDGLCVSDFDCKNITNGFCVDEKCGCKPGFVLEANVCVPSAIGAPCVDSCNVEHGICLDGFCECEENYVPYNSLQCYEKSDGLKDNCEVDVQCSATILYAKCLNKKCSCDESHTPYNGSCAFKADYGSYCNNRLECVISAPAELKNSIVCRNHICQCPTGSSREGDTCSSGERVTGVIVLTVLLLKFVFSVS